MSIGIENRYNWIGSNITTYVEGMKKYINRVSEEKSKIHLDKEVLPARPLLLVAFHQKR